LIGTSYKGKLPHFKISGKLRILRYLYRYRLQYLQEKNCWTLFSEFSSILGPKTHFREGRHENKEKRFFYLGFRILLLIQIQLLEIENPNKKIDFL
jgi:hypothetical protein